MSIRSPLHPTPLPHREETAWDIMDRLMQALHDCERTGEQIHLTLDALRQSLDADVVLWYSGSEHEAEPSSEEFLSSSWCCQVMEHILDPKPVDSLSVRNVLPNANDALAPWPHSWALACLSRTRDIWIAAGRFQPGRAFRAADLKILSLARRMLLDQRRQTVTQVKLKETLLSFIRCMTATIDAKDPTTGGHSERVARMAMRLGRQMCLPEPTLGDVYLGGILHDIGKIGVQDSILQKPDKLTRAEFAELKKHVTIGDRILANLKPFEHLRPGVRNHHERWDGKGYPDGLAGEETPFLARLLAVADACDAMLSPRPYRPAMSTPDVETILMEGAGSQWDPCIIEHFMACRSDLYSICYNGTGETSLSAVDRAANLNDSMLAPQRFGPETTCRCFQNVASADSKWQVSAKGPERFKTATKGTKSTKNCTYFLCALCIVCGSCSRWRTTSKDRPSSDETPGASRSRKRSAILLAIARTPVPRRRARRRAACT